MSVTDDRAAVSTAALMDTSRTPHVKLHAVGLRESEWTTGFWADRFAVCRDSLVPTMGQLMTATERNRFIDNFLIAAGEREGEHLGAKWDDGDFYKWLESAIAVSAQSQDAALLRQIDDLIEIVGRAQRADGYIHTPVLIDHRNGGDAEPFANPMDFEMYNMGHLITAAVLHHRVTGKTNFLDIAKKTADFLLTTFANPTPSQARHGICPAHLMALVEFYRLTGQRKYLDLAMTLLNMRDLVTDGDDDNQDRVPFRDQRQAVGHAVRATYLYAGAADIYTETGDKTLWEPLESIWDDLTSRKLYITGGCGALYDGASPDGAIDQSGIRRVHQAFGRNYQLPQSTAHNETCGAIGNLMWNWRMLLITGDSKYADLIELTLYNSVLAGTSLDGTRFFYTNTLRQLDEMPTELRWPRSRTKTIDCFCCPPNVARVMAESSQYAYATGPGRVAFVLYGGSTLNTTLPDGSPIELAQETNYPWDGRIRVTINAAATDKEVTLSFRIPAWAPSAEITVNGQTATGKIMPGTSHDVRRTWRAGDRVELILPIRPRLIEAHPLVEEARNELAVMLGPVVYCLESTDLPPGVSVLDVMLPADATLAPRPAPDLGGIVALEGEAFAMSRGQWSNQLYRDSVPHKPRRIPIRLIPYFAWDNRGPSEMSVWLPMIPSYQEAT